MRPLLFFKDADPVHAAKGAQLVKFLNTGQACISPNRLLVHKSLVEPFVETLSERVGKMKAGSGFEDGITIGPLVDKAAVAKVENQVLDATRLGAEVVCGGHKLTDDGLDCGYFYAPTVLDSVTPEMLI